jgi:hypothetical protein
MVLPVERPMETGDVFSRKVLNIPSGKKTSSLP